MQINKEKKLPQDIKNQIKEEAFFLEDGRQITIQTGELARQADGSALVRMGATVLLATVVAEKKEKEGIDFFPLTVDYKEKYSAVGRIPGGYTKREGRASDEEILVMRLVDRALRPLFPEGFHREVQVMISLLAYDGKNLPDALACLAASAALSLSGLPFDGPVSEVRIIRLDGKFVVNPNFDQLAKADMDLIVAASLNSIIMVEGEMKEVSEKDMLEAIKKAHDEIKKQIEAQHNLVKKLSISKEDPFSKKHDNENQELKKKIEELLADKIYDKLKKYLDKKARCEALEEILRDFKEKLSDEELDQKENLINSYFSELKKKLIRKLILEENIRLDGRAPDEIRPIWSKVDYLPGVHGSALFTRGETQSLTTVTLGSSLDANRKDNVVKEGYERFFLHYNFPPFSTGEVKPLRGVSRREIGHGNLAQRALKNMIPSDNPYTIRIISDILESNGSSSMASVCAGTLALMDAGIQITKPISGIAMGLVMDSSSEKHVILSDILGDEDHIGDMDFKVTGTKEGITACQMDIKIKGISYEILEKALTQAKKGRMYILDKMSQTLASPRETLKENAPKIFIFEIPKEFIGAVIGPGGKVIQEIQASTNTTIGIEELESTGKVEILGKNQEKVKEAISRIKKIAIPFIPELNKIYKTIVKSIKENLGAFLEIENEGTEGLLHISEIQEKRLDKISEILKEGDQIEVKCIKIKIDERKRMKISFSRKALLENQKK